MATAKDALRKLLAREVICALGHQAEWAVLSDPEQIDGVTETLDQLGYALVMTAGRNGFFLREESPARAEDQLRREAQALVAECRRIEDVTALLFAVSPDQEPPGFRTVIRAGSIIEAASTSSTVEDLLNRAAANRKMTSDTVSAKVINLLDGLAKNGYLTVESRKTDTYQITARFDMMTDWINNFGRLIPEVSDKLDEFDRQNSQGELFT